MNLLEYFKVIFVIVNEGSFLSKRKSTYFVKTVIHTDSTNENEVKLLSVTNTP